MNLLKNSIQLTNQPVRQKDRSSHKTKDFMAVHLFCFRLNNLFSFQIQRGVLGLYYLHLLQISSFQ
ncbi:hypothetical protein CQR43_14660 [Enterococcus faecium]|nr:hypothetical protein CQR43_14660 [Enterococcus faecium]